MIMFVVRHLMDMIIMLVLLIFYLMVIILYHVPEIKLLSFGKLARVLTPEPIMDIKSGLETLLFLLTANSWPVAQMIKVCVSGKSINKPQSIDSLHMTMS